MRLEWEWIRNGVYHGLVDGHCMAQVENVIGPSGSSDGWLVWLTHQPEHERLALYPTLDEGQQAAAAALSFLDPPQSGGRGG